MNKKATLLAGLLGLFAQQSYGIELKETVCVVKQNAGDSLLKVYEDVAKELANNGYFAAGRSMRAKGKGFGSGMVYKASNGKFYIITNHHVVGSMDYVDLEFEKPNGDKTVFTHCKVKARTTDEDEDVALVELPDTLKFKETIVPYTGNLKDGEEVWTAGFPGLGNQPVWQLGKGILSNVAVRPEGYKKGTIIQHTAQVDPGNSGGPLLIKVKKTVGEGKKKKTVENYEVIGLNTWKARFRENTNYSIPFAEAQRFADSVAALKTNKANVDLKTRVDSLVEAIKSNDPDKVEQYILPAMALGKARTSLKDMLANADDKSLKMLREGETEAALVRLTAQNVIANYSKKANTLTWSEVGDENGNQTTATLLYKGKPVQTTWMKEDGEWKLGNVDGMKQATFRSGKTPQIREGFFIDDPDYDFAYEASYGMNLGTDRVCRTYGFAGETFWRFVSWRFGINVQTAEYLGWDDFSYEYEYNNVALIAAETGVFGQVPLSLNNWQIIPSLGVNLQGGMWCSLDTEKGGKFTVYGVGGSKFGYVFKSGKMPFIQVDYSMPIYKSVERALEPSVNNLLTFRLGFAY